MAGQTSEKIERDWWYHLVRDVFQNLDEFPDFDAFFEELYDLFARAEVWRLFDDSVPTLDALQQEGYRLAMISNWDHRLFSIVEQLGLSRYFEHVTASAAVGVAKPGRAIFEHALAAMKVPPEDCVHVGDSLGDDYHGAVGAGLRAVLLDRANLYSSSGRPVPRRLRGRHGRGYNDVVRIKSLQELPALLS